jgi:hypothetical protein
MATRRIDWNRLRHWLAALGRRMANLATRSLRAAGHEASKDKYREYLSDAYGQMRARYPAVEDTAKEALDAIGVRPKVPAKSKRSKPSRGRSTKTTAGKTTRKKASARKTTRKKAASKKKAAPRKKAAPKKKAA